MITRDDVVNGYMHGAVVFADGRLFCGDGIVCRIGHKGWNFSWFYFGGEEAENYTNPIEYINDVGLDNALQMVTEALNESILEIDEDEYAFYECVLNEYKEEA